ncbi:hypothetical protein ACWHLZ_41965 [Streptomyces chartreusis]
MFSDTKLPQGAVDRVAYVVCVLEQLHRALNRRDIFATPSNRCAYPRARLLDGPRWEAMRGDVLAGLSLSEDVGEHLATLTRGLDAAWRQMADRLAEAGNEAKVEIVVPEDGGRARLSVDKLGAGGEPESLTWLRETTEAMLPGSTCRTCCSRCTPGPGSWTPSATCPPGPRGWRGCSSPGGAAGVRGVQHRAHPRSWTRRTRR